MPFFVVAFDTDCELARKTDLPRASERESAREREREFDNADLVLFLLRHSSAKREEAEVCVCLAIFIFRTVGINDAADQDLLLLLS